MTRYYRIFFHLTTVLSLSVLLASGASAQQTTGDITGRVTDALGNLVPNATVTATHRGTGQTRTATTNDAGDYTITQLPPGDYDVTVEASSFSKALLKELQVNIGSKQTVNVELKPGEITETVEISSDSVLVETTRSDLGGVVTPLEVENLPLLNRTFAALSVIMPEARPVGNFDPTKTRVGNVAL
ncbi:MAG: carboxypeptidase regulatory-like domain-containing protein [Acidobacteria bacterium]|nr:carboxypeptidase regulatory-like domain-containing protein [Acidobacteriota bacterium]